MALHREPDTAAWVTLADGRRDPGRPARPTRRRQLLWFSAAVLAISAVVLAGTAYVSRVMAERDAIKQGVRVTDLLAEAVIQPHLSRALVDGDAVALEQLDRTVRAAVLPNGVLRVKVFSSAGTVIYSDEPRLIDRTFALDPVERAVLTHAVTRASITSPAGLENEYERVQGRLLEVRRPVTSESGQRLLLEVYGDYASISHRARHLWQTFLVLFAAGTLLLLLLLTPAVRLLLRGLDEARRQAETALRAAVDASDQERRRLAASLHDGPVQELVASSLIVARSADVVAAAGHPDEGERVRSAAATVRRAIASLRTLLIDLYPPRFHDADLASALTDLTAPLRSRGVDIVLDVTDLQEVGVDNDGRRLIYRVASECLHNAVTHAEASQVSVSAGPDGSVDVVLDIRDNGRGFDVSAQQAEPCPGHVGLSIIADLSRQAGAKLAVASAPGQGTHWRLLVPKGDSS